MRGQRNYFRITLLISILVAIIFPLALEVKNATYVAIFLSSVWVIYSLILLGYVFLVEGRRNRKGLNAKKEDDPFPPELFQEWEALWEITVKKSWQSPLPQQLTYTMGLSPTNGGQIFF